MMLFFLKPCTQVQGSGNGRSSGRAGGADARGRAPKCLASPNVQEGAWQDRLPSCLHTAKNPFSSAPPPHTISFCKKCHNERRVKQGRRRGGGFRVEGAGRADGFSREVVGSFLVLEQFFRRIWERFTMKKKRWPDGSWKMQKCGSDLERTAGGNTRRGTRRSWRLCDRAMTCALKVC